MQGTRVEARVAWMVRGARVAACVLGALGASACSSSSGRGDGAPSSTADAAAASVDADAGPFDPFQERNLADVNMYRATMNVPPLVLDQTLSTFALAGSQLLSMDHSPHEHFNDALNDNSIWQDGFTSMAAENQGDQNGWQVLSPDPTMSELLQIDAIQQAMFDEGPGTGEAHGHYMNMMSSVYTRLGVGLLEVKGLLYLTNDFSD